MRSGYSSLLLAQSRYGRMQDKVRELDGDDLYISTCYKTKTHSREVDEENLSGIITVLVSNSCQYNITYPFTNYCQLCIATSQLETPPVSLTK